MIITCPKCRHAIEVPIGKWARNEEHVSRLLDFESMILTTNVSGMLDGEAMMHVREELAAAWSEVNASIGWTEEEWMRQGHQESEVRRMPDGRWETRLTYRHWGKAVALAQQSLEKPGFRRLGAESEFEELTGFSWQRFLHRETEPLPDVKKRPWSPLPDEWWPSIETAYQRYIHHG